jgi:hypothetical protein
MAAAVNARRLTVASQDVVPIQATDGSIIAERRVSSVVVVEVKVDPARSACVRPRLACSKLSAHSDSRVGMRHSTVLLARGR